MKKNKRIVLSILLILLAIILLHNVAYAESITAEQIVTSTDGSIDYVLKGLNLEEGASYQWAIEKTQNATIENWYDVLNPDYASGTIRISILATNNNQLSVLKSTDTGYLTIRKVGETSNILSNYKIDLMLPLLKAYTIQKSSWYGSAPTNGAYEVTTIYGINSNNVSFTWEKITDANVVNNYIDNNHDLSGLPLKGRESIPSLTDTTWKSMHSKFSSIYQTLGEINNNELPTEDGLYYLWLQGSDTDVKTVYGQAIIEVGTVSKITSTTDDGKNATEGNNENKETPKKEQETPTTGKTDPTIASKILPNTGVSIAIIGTILLVIVLGIGALAKYYTYKDIK